MTPRRARWTVAAALVGLCFVPLTARAGDEDCFSIPVTWYSPSGMAGCSLDGPTEGTASTYDGTTAAMNFCTYPWDDCGSVKVQSHVTGLEIIVPVGMYCDCWVGRVGPNGETRRLIDLTPSQVYALGLDPAFGLFSVTVTPIREGLVEPVLPDTRMVRP